MRLSLNLTSGTFFVFIFFARGWIVHVHNGILKSEGLYHNFGMLGYSTGHGNGWMDGVGRLGS